MIVDREKIYQVGEYEFINFCVLSKDKLLEICDWRNHPLIRRYMYNTGVIEYESHFAFVKQLENREDAYYWLVKMAGEDIGAINLVHYDKDANSAEIGLYLKPEKLNDGMGYEAVGIFMKFAFELMEIDLLWGSVHKENFKAMIIDAYWGAELNKDDLANRTDVQFIRWKLPRDKFIATYQEKFDFHNFADYLTQNRKFIKELKQKV